MTTYFSTVTSKGQVTIPKVVRERLGISTGASVGFVVESDGTVKLTIPRYSTVASLVGAAGSLPDPRSWDEMRDIAREDRPRSKAPSRP
ncbi:MAG: AbrB/MazE/SpoVT family DNA-binding domain-containing protein [Ktedonobacterales bacterium]